MPKIWIDKQEWETVKARLSHINIRMAANIKTAAVQPFGSGTSAGINIDLPLTGTPGDTYNGFFKLINTSDKTTQEITVTDGLYDIPNSSPIYAGYAVINDIDIAIMPTALAITAESFIYFQIAVDDTTASGLGLPEILQSPTRPEVEANKLKILLGRVSWNSEKSTIKAIAQEHHGQIHGYIFKTCVEAV
ncbi:MAG: hypothetical protein L3J71_03485 [Victivallaceae bacterium]|nr:hypothetical protein [Victivallaceae bacterium]